MSVGDKVWADKLLRKELKAERDDLWNIVRRSADYYRRRYGPMDQLSAAFRFSLHLVNEYVWGHGLKLKRLMVSGIMLIALFAVTCRFSPAQYAVRGESAVRSLNFF